ncbi:MAG: right-handed parallel beta-helix repeat-containing protein [Candidatus Hodarchaeales archaeon]
MRNLTKITRSSLLESPSSAWIGFTDEQSEGNWQWITGESVSYTNWESGEPNDSGDGEDYAEMLDSGFWNDAAPPSDPAPVPYLCEWEESQDSIDHDPISIDSNYDFISQATTEDWLGDGSETDPIIINNLKIASLDNLISISNTDYYFRISNCVLVGLGGGRDGGGISLISVSNAYITNNTIENVEGTGIYIEGSSNNIVTDNYIYNSVINRWTYGLGIFSGSSNNFVRGNNFIGNNLGGYSQAYDYGSNNEFSNNYWDDWTTPDVNSDGIVYNPYDIEGTANNQDMSPLTSPHIGITIIKPDEPILITSNDDFISQDFPGSGTFGDPYRIEGLEITDSTGNLINIQDTTAHFKIANNILDGVTAENRGIRLVNVKNGIIEYNTFHDNYAGIVIVASSDILIINNEIYDNIAAGIGGFLCNDTVISSNNVHGSEVGIGLDGSNNTIISGNIVYNNSLHGVHLGPRPEYDPVANNNMTVSHNIIYDNKETGIYLVKTSSSTITSNSIHDNGNQASGTGILITELSSNNIISSNNISNNVGYGIVIQVDAGISDNIVKWNNFIDNNLGGDSQAWDNGTNNLFTNNYWDEFTSPDTNADGYVDNQYAVDGSADSQDLTPLASAHEQSGLTITYPDGPTHDWFQEPGSQVVTIQWTPSTDSYEHDITYSLYYTFDVKTGWNVIVTDLTANSYDWDTSTLTISQCAIKIVATCSEGLITETSSHYLSVPSVYGEYTDGIIVQGAVDIEWSPSIDPLGHEVTYSVYLSSDNRETWTLLVSDLETLSYQWDTTTSPDSSSYRMRIVATCPDGITAEYMSVLFTISNADPFSSFIQWLVSALINILILVVVFILVLVVTFISIKFFRYQVIGRLSRVFSGSRTGVIHYATSAERGRCDFCGHKLKEGDYHCTYCYRRIARRHGRRYVKRATRV